jgi:iron complex outermembrane receptor protein
MLNKVTIRATFIALSTMLSVAAYAIADAPKRVDIPAGELSGALLQLSKQYGTELVYRPEQVHGLKTHGAHGQFTTEQAVTLLLQGTPLELRTDPSGAMLIAPPTSAITQVADNAPKLSGASSQDASDDSKEGKKSSSGDFRVAQLDQGTNPQSSSVIRNSATAQNASLTEIVVTAQKREERIQDVPVPVTVLSGQTLVDSNQLRIQDYYSSVPGFNVVPANNGSQFLSIRGITTGGFTSPTVAVVIDDLPYGINASVPDLDPGDLVRVEVLRGPQGALYGASGMGGLVKFVTVDPSTTGVSGHLQAGTSSVYNGSELGYSFRGSVNVPLSDTFAILASGFTREEPGYIDNPVRHEDALNKERVSGGRLAALWQPSEILSVKFSALYQDTKQFGGNDVETPNAQFPQTAGLGNLQQNDFPGTGGSEQVAQAYGITATAHMGNATLTSVSGYTAYQYNNSFDYTYALGGPGFGVPLLNEDRVDKVSEEIRLSMPLGPTVDWLLGGFYTHERSNNTQNAVIVDASTGAVTEDAFNEFIPQTYAEYAAFTDLTFHISSSFDIQVGGRESNIRQTSAQTETGPLLGSASPYVLPESDSKNNVFTYLVTPQFKISPDVMVYTRLASGYRPGGVNLSLGPASGTPPQYGADKTEDYEIGLKGSFFDHRLIVDTSAYYIDWKNIQLQVANTQTGFSYNINGSRAKSEGLEFSVQLKPADGLTLGAWTAFSNAVLTKNFPPLCTPGAIGCSSVYGAAGDRLPDSSRFSGNLSIEQTRTIGADWTASVGAVETYVGNKLNIFEDSPTTPREIYPAYAKTDLHGSLKHGPWTAIIFANNVTNKNAIIGGGDGAFPPFGFYILQPRTVGLSLKRDF